MWKFLRSRRSQLLSAFLITQVVLFHAYPKSEVVPPVRPMRDVARTLGEWKMVEESPLDAETMSFLKADDTLNRLYANPATGRLASLYMAYFKTQRTGVSPHSPKVCLPGSGWVPSESERIQIAVPGGEGPLNVNRYIVSKGPQKSLVLYWYQSAHRSVANEYAAKVYTVLDSIRYRRSDASIVRIVVPYVSETDGDADRVGVEFIRQNYALLRPHLPN